MTTPGDGVKHQLQSGGGGGGNDSNKLIVSIVPVPAEERSQPKKRQTVSIAAHPHSSPDASQKSRLVLFTVLTEAATLGTEMRRHNF